MNTLITVLIALALASAIVVMIVGPGREGPSKL
jgi:hypothetical protein